MPRLSNNIYIQRHRFLAKAWTEGLKDLFAVLKTNQQWDVHKYYRPSEQLSDQQLITYRKQITKTDPSLPQRASRSLMRMQDAFDAAYEAFEEVDLDERVFDEELRKHVRSGTSGKVRVTAIARPELDSKRSAGALIHQARQQLEEEAREEKAA